MVRGKFGRTARAVVSVLSLVASVVVSVSGLARPAGAAGSMSSLAAGAYHTCGLTGGGGVACWGQNGDGQLGDGTHTTTSTPVAVVGLSSGITAIAAGYYHSCGLTSAGGVKCWGRNAEGQLGDGTTTSQSTPRDVSGLSSGVASIAAGGFHTCAVMTSGGIKCWGYNLDGELGNNTITNSSTPVNVLNVNNATAVTAGSFHTCALRSTGSLACWGFNAEGQLGNGTFNDSLSPVTVINLSDGIAITAGANHTCALRSTRQLSCWGRNGEAQLGNGSFNGSTTPTGVANLNDGAAVVANGYHTCALGTTGGVRCWGNNSDGELGNGGTTLSTTPVGVSGLSSGVSALAAGFSHTCAVTTAGVAKCWGDNTFGQLGDGTTTDRLTPVDVVGAIVSTARLTVSTTSVGGVGTFHFGLSCTGPAFGAGFDVTTTSPGVPVTHDVPGVPVGSACTLTEDPHPAYETAAPQSFTMPGEGKTISVVNTKILSSISVTPANPSVARGGTQQFTATGTYVDGAQQDLTGSVTWSSSGSAATVNASGLATGRQAGSTTISAARGNVSGSTTLSVTATDLVVQGPAVSKPYGAPVPALPASYTGLLFSDTAPATPATCTTPATAASPPGSYPVTCSGASDPNYVISYAPGTLTVTKAQTELRASPINLARSPLAGNATMSANLRSLVTGQPIAGAPVSFTIGTRTCSATTDAAGNASCSVPIVTAVLNPSGYTATYAGSANYLPSSGTARVTVR